MAGTPRETTATNNEGLRGAESGRTGSNPPASNSAGPGQGWSASRSGGGVNFNAVLRRSSGRSGQVSGGSLFSTALRGYHRRQVDERIAVLTEQADAQRIRAEAAESDLSAALDQLRNTPQGGDADRGFGVRVEKLLRLAETEAAEVRTAAAQEATTLIEQARVDAQAHRREVENELTASAASVDQDNASRTARLNDREQEIDDQLAAAREQAAAIRAEADRDAAQVCEQAERELDRLTAVCAAVRTEMAKLHSVLGAELNLSDKIAIAQQS